MTKPRKATEKPAGASKAKAGTGQRKTGKRASESAKGTRADSELLFLESAFDYIESLRACCRAQGANDFQDMDDVENKLGDSIMKCKATTLAGLRIKAKAAKRWYDFSGRTPEEIADMDCELQWIASFVESIENLTN